MEKTGAIVDEFSIFVFKRLKEAVKLRIMATESTK